MAAKIDSLNIRPRYFDNDHALDKIEFARLGKSETVAVERLHGYLSAIGIDTVGGLIDAVSAKSIASLVAEHPLAGHAPADVAKAIGWALLDITEAERKLKKAPVRKFFSAAGGRVLLGVAVLAAVLFVWNRHSFMVDMQVAGDAIGPYQVITQDNLTSRSVAVFGGAAPGREALLSRLSLQSIAKGEAVKLSQLSRFTVAEPEKWVVWRVPADKGHLIQVGQTVSIWMHYADSTLNRTTRTGCVIDAKPRWVAVLVPREQESVPVRTGIAGVSPAVSSCLAQVSAP